MWVPPLCASLRILQVLARMGGILCTWQREGVRPAQRMSAEASLLSFHASREGGMHEAASGGKSRFAGRWLTALAPHDTKHFWDSRRLGLETKNNTRRCILPQ